MPASAWGDGVFAGARPRSDTPFPATFSSVDVARVDFTSKPNLATDEKLDELRAALDGLRDLRVARGDEDVIAVSFKVDASSLGEAVSVGERELAQRMEAAGIDFPYTWAGATGWA
jgi:hypothetical protein